MRSADVSESVVATAFTAEVARQWSTTLDALVRSAAPATLFQRDRWMSVWYRTLGSRIDLKPLIVTVRRRSDGALAAVLPLLTRAEGRCRVVEFADLDITDYNAPFTGPASPQNASGAKALLDAVIGAVSSDGDILRLTKMPEHAGGTPNPLTLTGRCKPSTVNGNLLRLKDTWEQHNQTLDAKFRRELERCLRVFERDGENARFVVAASLDEAMLILAAIEQQQRARMSERGQPYVLDGTHYREFYKALIAQGLHDGYAVVSALMTGETEVVAGIFGICDRKSYAMLRFSHVGGAWSHCSPGRLLIDRTMHYLHGHGVREFDFTTGDYDYKTRFGAERVGLYDLHEPLSLLGRLIIGRQRVAEGVKQKVRRYPVLHRSLKAVRRGIASD